MKAILLAGGKGRRLAPLTEEVPKCMVKVGNKTIIEYQLDSLKKAGINDIVIIGGYFHEKLKSFLLEKYPSLNFKFFQDPKYAYTNTLHGLYVAREAMDDDFLLFNADVIFHHDILKRVLESEHKNALAVEKKQCTDEEVKVRTNGKRILEIGKHLDPSDCAGEFIGIAKFSKEATPEFKKRLENFVHHGMSNFFFEAALQSMINDVEHHEVDISDLPCTEIDFLADLKRAETFIDVIEESNK